MTGAELVEQLRAWARRHEPRSPERRLYLRAAEELESRPYQGAITVEAIEEAIGGPLLPWQKARLEARDTPPTDTAA